MAKPILQYKVNTLVNPLTQEKVYTPMLTDRAPAVPLETYPALTVGVML